MLVVLPKVESSWVRESVLGLARALKGRPDPASAVEVRAVTREPDGDGERARVRLTLHTTTGHLPPAAPVVTREIEVSLVRPRGYRRWRVSGRRCLMVL